MDPFPDSIQLLNFRLHIITMLWELTVSDKRCFWKMCPDWQIAYCEISDWIKKIQPFSFLPVVVILFQLKWRNYFRKRESELLYSFQKIISKNPPVREQMEKNWLISPTLYLIL